MPVPIGQTYSFHSWRMDFMTMERLLLGFKTRGMTSIFPFMSSNIPSAPAYGVYVSQLDRYCRA